MSNWNSSAPPIHGYRPDIDGLRAVAVLAVVVFHAFPNSLPGGFVGVDIFFVISGFLISSIIHKDLERGTFTISGFYVRRIRRIFPALLTVMLAVLAVGWLLLLPNEFRKVGQHIVGGGAFVSNLFLWHESGYFDASAETKPLLHLWSLAIEEQYYLGWPILMALVWKLRGNFLLVNAILIAISFSLNLHCVEHYPTAAYYMPFSRFWELFAGAMLAHLSHRGIRFPSGLSKTASLAGSAFLLAAFTMIDKSSAFPGWWAVLPVAGSFLLLGSGHEGWVNRRVLSCKPMVWIGLVSYPLYLWHWPVLSYLRIDSGGTPPLLARSLGVVAAMALAYATYRWIERPIRYNASRRTIPALLAGMVGICLVGIATFFKAIPPRHSGPDIDKILAASLEWTFPGELKPVARHPGLHELPTSRPEKTLFIGDSHIEHYTDRISKIALSFPDSSNGVLLVSRGGCPPLPGIHKSTDPGCTESVERAFALAERTDVRTVVVAGCWNCYLAFDPNAEQAIGTLSVVEDGVRRALDDEGLRIALDRLMARLRDLKSRGKHVFLVLDTPSGDGYDPMLRLQGGRLLDFRISPAVDSIEIDPVQTIVRRKLIASATANGVPYLDPEPILCSATRCLSSLPDGTPVIRDGNHLRSFFVESRASFLDKTLFAR